MGDTRRVGATSAQRLRLHSGASLSSVALVDRGASARSGSSASADGARGRIQADFILPRRRDGGFARFPPGAGGLRLPGRLHGAHRRVHRSASGPRRRARREGRMLIDPGDAASISALSRPLPRSRSPFYSCRGRDLQTRFRPPGQRLRPSRSAISIARSRWPICSQTRRPSPTRRRKSRPPTLWRTMSGRRACRDSI